MTFETLVTGEFNEFAYSAAKGIIKKGIMYNPILIQAETGLGKTHILKAILNEAKVNRPEENHLYISCESFVHEFINSIKENNKKAFREKYQSIHLLLIDDIQFLSNKSATQEEITTIFNWLYDHGSQIVLSTDCNLEEISGLTKRGCRKTPFYNTFLSFQFYSSIFILTTKKYI